MGERERKVLGTRAGEIKWQRKREGELVGRARDKDRGRERETKRKRDKEREKEMERRREE